jgi:hypothetical protein
MGWEGHEMLQYGKTGGDEDQRRHGCHVDKGSGDSSIVHVNIKEIHDGRQRQLRQKLRKGHRNECTTPLQNR